MVNLTLSEAKRFWSYVDRSDPDGCWLWLAFRDARTYGQFTFGGRHYRPHRIAYELMVGAIPDGLVLDHLCRVPACVNPDHLEPVTTRENLLRGNTITAAHAAKTGCPHGHPYSPENTAIRGGSRVCRVCERTGTRLRAQARRAKAVA